MTARSPKTAPAAPPLRGDEGMWTLDNLPLERLRELHGFVPPPGWAERLQKASARFNDGGSGAFVSAEGLILTNHHVALGQLQKMSTPEKDYVRDGFLAARREDEIRCPDLEVNVLMSMEDVTARVLAAAGTKGAEKERNERRKAEIARVTKESTDATGLRSDVVELYQGGEYWLYRYKKHVDLRLVMAPELQAAFYGGDLDNFTYPRCALDFAFFRAYADGRPVRPESFLPWSPAGAAEGQLVFVTGHPGHTDRLKTAAELEYERDLGLPLYLEIARRRLAQAREYAARGAEQSRRVKERVFGLENALKAVGGEHEGLLDPALLREKRGAEASLRRWAAASKDPAARAARGSWAKIAAAQKRFSARRLILAYRRFDAARVAGIAAQVVRHAAETAKPNERRWEEYRESNLESLRFRLLSPAPLYPDLEEFLLARALEDAARVLGKKDEFVKAALGGRPAAEVARELVAGTRLFDPEERRRLLDGGAPAVAASKDPLVAWQRRLDPVYRAQRAWYEDSVESVLVAEGNRIARARFAAWGKSTYPDATFTLRLSFGRVAGYEQGTTLVAPFTTYHALLDRAAGHGEKPPFDLSPRVKAALGRLDLGKRLNFVTTNDIIGGNSGSPVVDAEGRYVGLIFDGNIQSLVGRYAYDDARNRAVAVHSDGIVEALRSIYAADALAAELTSPR